MSRPRVAPSASRTANSSRRDAALVKQQVRDVGARDQQNGRQRLRRAATRSSCIWRRWGGLPASTGVTVARTRAPRDRVSRA